MVGLVVKNVGVPVESSCVGDKLIVGDIVGSLVGDAVGSLLGAAVGSLEGNAVGSLVGGVCPYTQ